MTLSPLSNKRTGNVFTYLYRPGTFIDLQVLLDSQVAAVHTSSTVGTLTVDGGCVGTPPCPQTNTTSPDTFFARETLVVEADGTEYYRADPTVVIDEGRAASSSVPPIAGEAFTVSVHVYAIEKPSSSPYEGADYTSRTIDVANKTDVASYGHLVRLSGECVTLSAGSGPGVLAGELTVATDSNGKATWTGLTYSAPTSSLSLTFETTTDKGASSFRVGSPLTTSIETPVLASVDASSSGSASPGVAYSATVNYGAGDVTATASASLSNGAYGNVHLWATPMPCLFEYQVAGGHNCELVSLDLVTKQWDAGGAVVPGSELYSPLAPASVSLTCDSTLCPANAPALGLTQAQQDYLDYPIKVDLRVDLGGYLGYVGPLLGGSNAPTCVATGDTLTTGQLGTAAALAAGYCVDVNAITRSGGDLVRPILFVEDPRWGSTSK